MGYWVQLPHGERSFCSSLKDAYSDAAKILIGQYKFTKGNIHKTIIGYHGGAGIKIFDSRTGKSCNHWVRFTNGTDPKGGYEEVYYDKRIGIVANRKEFPKSWLL